MLHREYEGRCIFISISNVASDFQKKHNVLEMKFQTLKARVMNVSIIFELRFNRATNYNVNFKWHLHGVTNLIRVQLSIEILRKHLRQHNVIFGQRAPPVLLLSNLVL